MYSILKVKKIVRYWNIFNNFIIQTSLSVVGLNVNAVNENFKRKLETDIKAVKLSVYETKLYKVIIL